ncbi:MAG: phospholipase D-like domain-containing protein [Candidatus Obscuribacterales bacterium]
MEVNRDSVLAKLEKVNSELACLRPSYQLLVRIERLRSYLQAPDSSSEFAEYQRFQREYERAAEKLSRAASPDSIWQRLLSRLNIVGDASAVRLRVEVCARSLEELRIRLGLFGNMSLEQELGRLNNYVESARRGGADIHLIVQRYRSLEKMKVALENSLSKTDHQVFRFAAFDELGDGLALTKHFVRTGVSPHSRLTQTDGGNRSIFDEKCYFDDLMKDLRCAVQNVLIVSPYLSLTPKEKIEKILETLVQECVNVIVVTKHPKEQREKPGEQQRVCSVIEGLQSKGVRVFCASKIHQKLLLIDRKVCWEGSLNWLGHKDTYEHVTRTVDAETIFSIEKKFNGCLALITREVEQKLILMKGRETFVRYTNLSPAEIADLLYGKS